MKKGTEKHCPLFIWEYAIKIQFKPFFPKIRFGRGRNPAGFAEGYPDAFRVKSAPSPLRLLGATVLLIAIVSFLMILPLSFLAKANRIFFEFSIYLVFSLCMFFFLKELGVDVIVSFKKAITDKSENLKISAKYLFGFMLVLFMIVLGIYLVLFFLDYNFFKSGGVSGNHPDFFKRNGGSHNSFFSCLIFFLNSCVLAPFLEEAYFRRLFYVALRKKMFFVPALLITALLFAVLHPNMISGLIGGLYLTYMYEKEKNIAANMLVHSAANFVIILSFIIF